MLSFFVHVARRSKPNLIPKSQALTLPFESAIVPRSRCKDCRANYGQHNPQGNFCARGEARVAGERVIARFAAGLLGCERASLQAGEKRIGGVVDDVHCGEREHRRVVV